MSVKLYGNSRFELYGKDNDGVYLHELRPEYVSVIAMYDNCLVVVNQYRQAVGQETIELPGGRMEGGDGNRAEGARRELLEETGLECGELHYVGMIHSYACMINRCNHFYFTNQVIAEHKQNLDDDEDIQVLRVPIEEVYANVKNGLWTDSEIIAGLNLAKLHGFL